MTGSFVTVQEPGALADLFSPETNIAVLRREPSIDQRRLAARLATGTRDLYFGSIAPNSAGVNEIRAHLPEDPAFDAFAATIAFSLELFADVTGAREVGARLVCLQAPMCPRFHVDRVLLRMLTTFAGPTTQWLDEAHVDRRWLGEAARGRPDEETGLLRPEAVVQQCQAFDMLFLKGESWPGNEGRGAVHRSPPTTEVDPPRLIMTLDALA